MLRSDWTAERHSDRHRGDGRRAGVSARRQRPKRDRQRLCRPIVTRQKMLAGETYDPRPPAGGMREVYRARDSRAWNCHTESGK